MEEEVSSVSPAQRGRPKEGGLLAGINYVLIRPEADNTTMEGLAIAGDWDRERQWSVFGRVVAVPGRLWFAKHIPEHTIFNQFISDNSLEYDADNELVVGDRVLFRYNVRMDEDGMYEDDEGLLLMVKYDMIYAKANDGDIVPVNGWVFAVGDEVAFAGKPHRGYLLHPERQDFDVAPGDKIAYAPRRGVRIEAPEFSQLGALVRMQRKEILVKKITYL